MFNSFAHFISGRNRERKFNEFIKYFGLNNQNRILDIGFSDIEYSPNDNYLEKNYPFKTNITALGIDKPNNFKKLYPQTRVIQYDGNVFPFIANEFDLGWSNAVLEHVGNFDDQVLFLKEIKRTCRKAFITTPNKLFPIEIHTRIPLLHWLPKKKFDSLLFTMGKEWATGSYMNLLTHNDLLKLLYAADINKYKIIRNRLYGITMDFSIIL